MSPRSDHCGVAYAPPRAPRPVAPPVVHAPPLRVHAAPAYVAPPAPPTPRAPLQIEAGLPRMETVVTPARRFEFTLTDWQRKHIDATIAATFEAREVSLVAGFVPLRLDVQPDGRARVVLVMVPMPPELAPPGKNLPAAGRRVQAVVPPASPDGSHWWYAHWTGFDLDPRWTFFRDLRVVPKAGPAFTETLSDALDRSGYKQAAKLREVRDAHARRVIRALHYRRPVAPEVLQDYPGLAQFYRGSLQLAGTAAERRAARDVIDNPENPHVTVSWSPQEGLIIVTRGKEQAIIDAVRNLNTKRIARFKWSHHLQFYYRPQSVGVSYSTADIDAIVQSLRDDGLVVAVERGEISALGVANERRQEHKFWRADVHAGRAERAVERADERIDRAATIREDLPVGAATARAERAEARAERAEEKASEHLAYGQRATGAAESLARQAASFDVTAALTRKDIERAADAFGALFTRQAKGLTGASKLESRKKDNLSEYKLTWLVSYPPSANASALVTFDGRSVAVASADANGRNGSTTLREDVTGEAPEAVFAKVIAAMPKFVADAATHAPTEPRPFAEELSLYGRRRTVAAEKAAGVAVEFHPAREMYGNWQNLHLHEKATSYAGGTNWTLITPPEGLVFTLRRTKQPSWSGSYENRPQPIVLGEVTLDFADLSIAEAWDLYLAGLRAIAAGQPLVPPARKGATRRAAVTHEGVGAVQALARDAPDAVAASRAAEVSRGARKTRESIATRRAALQGESAPSAVTDALTRAKTAGNSLGFYPTAPSLAAHVVALSGVTPGQRALDPSAGLGGIVDALLAAGASVTAIELQPDRAAYLAAAYDGRDVEVLTRDFLQVPPPPEEARYDVVVMNPPFSVEGSRTSDAEHVRHALAFVRRGGRLVAIMSPGSVQADNRKRASLHDALTQASWSVRWEPVEAGRFRMSGTDIPTVILVADRPGEKSNGRRRSQDTQTGDLFAPRGAPPTAAPPPAPLPVAPAPPPDLTAPSFARGDVRSRTMGLHRGVGYHVLVSSRDMAGRDLEEVDRLGRVHEMNALQVFLPVTQIATIPEGWELIHGGLHLRKPVFYLDAQRGQTELSDQAVWAIDTLLGVEPTIRVERVADDPRTLRLWVSVHGRELDFTATENQRYRWEITQAPLFVGSELDLSRDDATTLRVTVKRWLAAMNDVRDYATAQWQNAAQFKENGRRHAEAPVAPWTLESTALAFERRFITRAGLLRVSGGYLVWAKPPGEMTSRVYDRYGREYTTADLARIHEGLPHRQWIPYEDTVILRRHDGTTVGVGVTDLWEG